MRLLLVVLTLFSLGCAAMVRTWEFSASAMDAETIAVRVEEALVKQKTVFVTLEVRNKQPQAVSVEAGTFEMQLTDGTRVVGKIATFKRAAAESKKLLRKVGLLEGSDADDELRLAQDETVTLKLNFRSFTHDLRRQERMVVFLAGLRIDGASVAGDITLSAPNDAPVGEGI